MGGWRVLGMCAKKCARMAEDDQRGVAAVKERSPLFATMAAPRRPASRLG